MATTTRLVPYKNFKFLIAWDGKTVAGVNKISALSRTTEVVAWRAGGDPSMPHKSPGQSDYGPITIERGLTEDVEFEQWANKVWDLPNSAQPGQEVSLADFRKDITITLLNEAGQPAMAWNVYKCWVSEFSATSEFDASSNAVAIASMTLQNDGWFRDASLTSPTPPSFVDPAAS